MSKKKKKKYYQQASSGAASVASGTASVPNSVSNSMNTTSSAKPVVDKLTPVYSAHAEEYRLIRNDLIRVAIVNGIFLAAVLALYYVNRTNPFLETWYNKLF